MYQLLAALVLMLLAPAVTCAQKECSTATTQSAVSYDDGSTILARYKIVKMNGGPNGFNNIKMHVSDERGYLNCLLICLNPGYDKGQIDRSIPSIDNDPPRLLAYVDDQLGRGVTDGSYSFSESGVRYVINWNGSDPHNVTIEELHLAMK